MQWWWSQVHLRWLSVSLSLCLLRDCILISLEISSLFPPHLKFPGRELGWFLLNHVTSLGQVHWVLMGEWAVGGYCVDHLSATHPGRLEDNFNMDWTWIHSRTSEPFQCLLFHLYRVSFSFLIWDMMVIWLWCELPCSQGSFRRGHIVPKKPPWTMKHTGACDRQSLLVLWTGRSNRKKKNPDSGDRKDHVGALPTRSSDLWQRGATLSKTP